MVHLIKKIALLLVPLTLLLSGCSSPQIGSNHSSSTIEPIEATSPEQARQVIVQEAAQQIGKPYKLSGNSPREGFDCSGLVFYSYLKAGKLLPRRAEDQYLSAHKTKTVKPGDLLFFTTDSRGKHIDHVGIYLGQQKFIHAPGRGRNVCTADVNDDYWQKRLIGVGDYLE